MAETKEWRVKLTERGHKVEWELQRLHQNFDESPFYSHDSWEWESGGWGVNEKQALKEAEAAKQALVLKEQQDAAAKFIELGE